MTQAKIDHQLSLGFDAGNYANAYETQNYSKAITHLSMNRSDAYHSTYGQRCVELGYVDAIETENE